MVEKLEKEKLQELLRLVYESAQGEDSINAAHLRNKLSLWNYLRIIEEIHLALPPQARILDWGCGYCQMSFFLKKIGFNVLSYDVQDAMVKTNFFREIRRDVIIGKDSIKLPFPDGSFDAVLSCGVLEHACDKEGSLAELRRILKNHGYFFIYMLPNFFSYAEFINTLMRKSDHEYKYTPGSIQKCLKENQFIVSGIKRHNLIPKCFKLNNALQKFFQRLYSNYESLLLLESGMLKMPIINIFSGTLEIVARKQ